MMPIESLNQYKSGNVITFDKAIVKIKELRTKGKKVELCHSGFDITRPVHARHFELAKQLCNVLFVSITFDRFVSDRNGSGSKNY